MQKKGKMNKSKSILRAKNSAVNISDILAREGLAMVMPGGGLFYDASKALFQHGKQYFKDRTEIRLNDFHHLLLSGNFSEKEFKEFLEKDFDLDDYYSILSSCIQDIEEEKIELYSQLMQSLIVKTIDPNLRRHFIVVTNLMTYLELSFLKELYINSKFDLMTVGGTSEQVKKLLSSQDFYKGLAVEKLISNGFVMKDKSGLTEVGEKFTETIFSSGELKPESIGREAWTGINVVIVSYQLGDNGHIKVGSAIQKCLRKINVKSSIQILAKNTPIAFMLYGAGILLVGDKKIDDKYMDALKLFSSKRPMLRVNLNKNYSNIEIKDIEFVKEYTLVSEDLSGMKIELDELLIKIFSQN